jgi:hypothetical protein
MIAMSAIVPFVIQRLVPFRTQPSPLRSARVAMPVTKLPKSGSVRPKHPIFSPAAMPGNQVCFCSSLP